jgi:hypothetical protein
VPLRLALLLAALLAPTAQAAAGDVACVGVQRPDCTLESDSLTAALAAEPSVVHLGPGPHKGTYASSASVEIAGSEGTVIRPADPGQPTLTLTGADVVLRNARVEGRLVAGAGGAGLVRLADLDLADLELDGAETTARHLTVMGATTVDGGSALFVSSVLARPDPFAVAGGADVTTRFSAHAEDADATADGRIDAPADPRAVAGSALVDAGDPAPLAPFEPFDDALGAPRVTDGDGDGVLRRDIGAYEVQPAPTLMPASNVLVNGGAEDGPAGWSGTFTTAEYGDPFLPTAAAGVALGGGARFFSAGEVQSADLFQRIDVSAAAASIDRGLGRAALTGLFGGYGADGDLLGVRAIFKDPENAELGRLAIPLVTAADRANVTTLLPRTAAGAIPPRTRAIDVLLHAERVAGGYTDAYADNLSLRLSVPGVPVDPPGDPTDPPVTGLRPFHGVAVLTARPQVAAGGRAKVRLACADVTVGACRGSLRLRARLPQLRQIAHVSRFVVRPGSAKAVTLHLLDWARERLARRDAQAAALVATAYDGQGLRRRATVPVTLELPARRR